MKRLIFPVSMAVVLLSLFSCATVEEGSFDTADAGSSSMETPKAEPVIVWKPSTETFSYVDGTVDRRIIYDYDESGRLLTSREFDGRGDMIEVREFRYDGSSLVGRRVLDDQGLLSRTEFVMDDRGNTVEEINFDAEDRLRSTVSYRYEGSHIAESVASNASGVPQLKSTYIYKGDHLASVEYASPGGGVEARFVRSFEGDRVIEETTFLSDGTVEKRKEYLYENGTLAGEVYYSGNSRSKSVEYEHDGEGNIVVEKWFSRQGREYEIVDRTWVSFEIES